MASLTVPNRFALLVGVDFYLNDGSRQLPDGNIVSLTNLQGAVNDVRNIQTILHDRFQFNEFTTLTSSPSADLRAPIEPEDEWPSNANIKKAFYNILDRAHSGDVFFFHFSGHGALLKRTHCLPTDGRSNDPSLMTADYCCGKPAIRGWELNYWLQQFNKKNVRIIVLLDSCYSGGAWRNDGRFRSPDNWTPPPNLPADEAAVQGTQRKPGHRYGELGVSWDINPKDFTLMAACQSTEMAAERNDEGATHGAFTFALKTYFQNRSKGSTPTYRAVRDHATSLLTSWNISQKPQVFGRDRLAFLEDYEPFLVTPIVGVVQDDIVSLPVGEVHSIKLEAEFITTSMDSKSVVTITEVGDHDSKAKIKSGIFPDRERRIELIPFRWSAKEIFQVVLSPNLEHEFRETLCNELEKRISGNMQYLEESEIAENRNSEAVWFRLGTKKDGGIDIFGPEQLMGAPGPVRGWKVKGESDSEKARDSARAIAHLFRFGQIFHLRNEYQDTAPFQVTFESKNTENSQKVRYMFQNNGNEELHFAVLVLSSGFHVKQLFPANDSLQTIPPFQRRSFIFSLTVPDELRRNESQDGRYEYREIIRTVVTRGKNLSLKSMELPDIWNADQLDNDERFCGLGRGAELLEDFSWWVQDELRFTI